MAKKKDKTILALAVGGLFAYVLLKPKKGFSGSGFNYYQNYPDVPPAPTHNNNAFLAWAQTIVGLFGTVASLWEPGGPFHNSGITPEMAEQLEVGITNFNWP
ncbi:MAG: hypothetical protein KDC34_19005 [Saprospiraceae bacterium]|nr:hypothetical protein [Saprospiraceae bacterium]